MARAGLSEWLVEPCAAVGMETVLRPGLVGGQTGDGGQAVERRMGPDARL